MKKKIILMSVAAVLAMTAIIGGTLAGFNTQSEQGKTDITTKSLGIDLTDVTGGSFNLDDQTLTATAKMPGSEVAMSYAITNNVAEGYSLYARVTVYKYWEDIQNADLEADKITLYVKDADGNNVELAQDEATDGMTRVNDWFIQYADDEQIILYYAKPLAAGESTGNVMDSLVIDQKVGNAYTNQNIVVEIEADAVQQIAAESAMPSEWGVYPSFDENGNIVSIAE